MMAGRQRVLGLVGICACAYHGSPVSPLLRVELVDSHGELLIDALSPKPPVDDDWWSMSVAEHGFWVKISFSTVDRSMFLSVGRAGTTDSLFSAASMSFCGEFPDAKILVDGHPHVFRVTAVGGCVEKPTGLEYQRLRRLEKRQ